MKSSIPAILLAAGGSTRMGVPKQLIDWQGRSLVKHVADTIAGSECHPIIVMVGCQAERVREELRDMPATFVENRRWNDGIGTSIAAGVEHVRSHLTDAAGVMIMLCDQPLVTSGLLNDLVRAYETGNHVAAAACSYSGTIGVPAVFSRELFDDLKSQDPSHGAKQILLRHAARLATVEFPPAAIDIDTPEQYQQLMQRQPTCT